jgi:hypothetical protein
MKQNFFFENELLTIFHAFVAEKFWLMSDLNFEEVQQMKSPQAVSIIHQLESIVLIV